MNELDNKFKNALQDYTELPAPAIWDRIEAALDEQAGEVRSEAAPAQPATGLRVVFRKRVVAWGSMAATLALLITTVWPEASIEPVIIEPETVQETPTTPRPVLTPKEELPGSVLETSTATTTPNEVAATTPKSAPTPNPSRIVVPVEAPNALPAKNTALRLTPAMERNLSLAPVAGPYVPERTPKSPVSPFLRPSTDNIASATDGLLSNALGKTARRISETTGQVMLDGVVNWERARTSVNQTLANINLSK